MRRGECNEARGLPWLLSLRPASATGDRMKAWLSYAWKDNTGPAADDVTYIVQELERAGLEIRYDRQDLVPGQPLWPQIERHIQDPRESDAWIFVITANSLSSKPCIEELLYALDRALDRRKGPFPLIGLVMGRLPEDIPAALRVRLWVSTDEDDWAMAVTNAAQGQKRPLSREVIQPFHLHLCDTRLSGCDHVFEVRPRLGSWAPFVIGLPEADKDRYSHTVYAPATRPDCATGHQSASMEGPLGDYVEDGYYWRGARLPAVTPDLAAHVLLRLEGRDLQVKFGKRGGRLYEATLQPRR